MTIPEALRFAAHDYLSLQSLDAPREIRETAHLRLVFWSRRVRACTPPASNARGVERQTSTTPEVES